MHAADVFPVHSKSLTSSAKTSPGIARIKSPVNGGVGFHSSMQRAREWAMCNFLRSESNRRFRIISVYLEKFI